MVMLIVVASLSVAGCSNNSTKPTSSNIGSNNNPAVSLTVNSVATTNKLAKYPFEMTATPGNHYVVVDVTLTNLNKNDLYMGNLLNFRLNTYDGAAYSFSSLSGVLLNNTLEDQFHTNPGDKVTGQIMFEIPQSAKATALTYADSYNPPVTTNL